MPQVVNWYTGSDRSQWSVVNSMQEPSEIALVQITWTEYIMKCYQGMVDQITQTRILRPLNKLELEICVRAVCRGMSARGNTWLNRSYPCPVHPPCSVFKWWRHHNNQIWYWQKREFSNFTQDDRKHIERHSADTIVSWPNPKQWVTVHTSDLMMIIRQSILSQSSQQKWVNWKHTAPHIV